MRCKSRLSLAMACVLGSVVGLIFVPTGIQAAGCGGGGSGMMRGGGSSMMMMGGMRSGMGMGQGMGMGSGGMNMSGMGQQACPTNTARIHPGNDPETVLARKDELALTEDQVRRLEKMKASGAKLAMQVLTKQQKDKLCQLVGPMTPGAMHDKMPHGMHGKMPQAPDKANAAGKAG